MLRIASKFMILAAIIAASFLSAAAAPVQTDFIQAPLRRDFTASPTGNILYVTYGPQIRMFDIRKKRELSGFLLPEADLVGIDLSPDGKTLAVADLKTLGNVGHVWLIEVETGYTRQVQYGLEFREGGSFSVAFAGDGSLLFSTVLGSGQTPLRRHDPKTGETRIIARDLNSPAIFAASADRSVVVWTESGISDGPVGLYRTASGEIIRREGYEFGVGFFTYAAATNAAGSRSVFPTYKGAFVFDGLLGKFQPPIGTYAGPQPVGAAYHPKQNLVYFSWATTNEIRVFGSLDLVEKARIPLTNPAKPLVFDHPGNQPYKPGHMRISPNGKYLFVAVSDGIAVVRL